MASRRDERVAPASNPTGAPSVRCTRIRPGPVTRAAADAATARPAPAARPPAGPTRAPAAGPPVTAPVTRAVRGPAPGPTARPAARVIGRSADTTPVASSSVGRRDINEGWGTPSPPLGWLDGAGGSQSRKGARRVTERYPSGSAR